MLWDENQRQKRRHNPVRADQRPPFHRDRDRVLYCSHYRRLAGVTQIVRTGESDVFHTRLTHSMKVAQIGRRLAETRVAQQKSLCEELGVHPEVVEAACLAHDLGHPPFGHVGETTLHSLLAKESEKKKKKAKEGSADLQPDGADSYEGNAQAFRVVTKLAARFDYVDGLDLTRATLAAVLKYPWIRDTTVRKKKEKWGAYLSEEEDFEFAREFLPADVKSPEAELMDWADDIAYSVHDLEDFHRCRGIPWHLISIDEAEQARLVDSAVKRWFNAPPDARPRLAQALGRLLSVFRTAPDIVGVPYDGSRDQRSQLRHLTSLLIGRYVEAITLRDPTREDPRFVSVDPLRHDEVLVLKEFTRLYVIENPSLAAQQRGHRRVIEDLFEDLMKDLEKGPRYFPTRWRHLLEDGVPGPRAVADCISGLTEAEALAFHGRLRGYASGSVLDPILR